MLNLTQALTMLKPNKKNAIVAAATVIFAVFAGGVFCPMIIDSRQIAAQIAEKKTITEEYRRRIANAQDFTRFAQEEKEKFAAAAAVFADAAMPLDLIGFFEAAAESAGVEIEFLPLLPQTKEAGWPFMKIEIKLVGGSLGIWRFIEMTENSPYLAEIETVSVVLEKPLHDATAENSVRARIMLKIYAKH